LDPTVMEDLRADGSAASAAIIRRVLAGEAGPARSVTLANAAAALWAAERVDDLREGVRQAAESIDSGRAAAVLKQMATA
jgi:anthranilate phosphoribosyltransferase